MKQNPKKLWLIALALGWLFDFLFWQHSFGVNFAIFWTLALIATFYLLLSDGLRPHRNSLILIPLFIFFAVVTFFRAEPMTVFLASTFTLLTLTILTITYLGGRWFQYTLVDFLAKTFAVIASIVARPVSFSMEARKAQAEAGIQPAKYNFMPIVRGVVIALPIVAIFASLLSSADVVFGQRLDDFIKLFNLEDLPEYISRLIYILVIGYALAGIVLHAATESKDEKLIGEDKPTIPAFLGFVESTIILGSVVVLFAAFVVIQFQYFFGGTTNINVEGYTYAEYARNGFGELVAVAFFALLMLQTLSAITKRENQTQRKIYSAFGVALVALLLVMLVSAYQRLNLYEAAYGFSRLRTYTHVFLVWLGLLLIATIALEIFNKERMFAFAILIASFGFAMSLPILNVDAFIVNQNIQRELSGTGINVDQNTQQESNRGGRVELDSQYFIQLSDDAVPALVNTLRSSGIPDSVREKVAAALACFQYDRELLNDYAEDYTWQEFNFSRHIANTALRSVRNELDTIQITESSYPVYAITPSGAEYSCSRYYFD